MAIHWNQVLGIAPELTCVAIDTQVAILGFVNAELAGWPEGYRRNLASCYLAAHLATVTSNGAGGPSGPVTSESVGGLSRSYAQTVANTAWSQSPYGMAYASLVHTDIRSRLPGVA